MKAVLFLIILYFGQSHANGWDQFSQNGAASQQHLNTCQNCGNPITGSGVNDGASTSSDEEVNRCQRCELQNYVNRLVFLMFAEDRYGHNDLMFMAHYRFDELEGFFNYVNSYIMLATMENSQSSQVTEMDRFLRLQSFDFMVEEIITNIFEVACSQHYTYNLFYSYNKEVKEIFIYENLEAKGYCLCNSNDQCNRLMARTFPYQRAESESPKQYLDLDEQLKPNTTYYQIIPLRLISKFFNVWLTSSRENPNSFNGCVNTLLSRLRRSIQKLVIYSVKNSVGLPRTSETDGYTFNDNFEYFTVESFEQNRRWIRGNTFVGPTNRGPFNPRFQRTGDDVLRAFDHDAEPVIGLRRYQELLNLFHRLQNFIWCERPISPSERLIEGFIIYIAMTRIFTSNRVTPINWDDWQLRYMIYEELQNIPGAHDRLSFLMNQFYTTRKLDDNNRPGRALFQETEKSAMENRPFKNQWSEFIMEVMKVASDARSRNESLSWMCKFSRFYRDYLFRDTVPSDDKCSNCLSFDEYLYTKILKPNNFTLCSYSGDEVCVAWRAVADVLDESYALSKSKDQCKVEEKLKLDSRHLEIIFKWTSSPRKIRDSKELKKLEYTLVKSPSVTSVVDTSLCYLWTIVPTLITWKSDCQKM